MPTESTATADYRRSAPRHLRRSDATPPLFGATPDEVANAAPLPAVVPASAEPRRRPHPIRSVFSTLAAVFAAAIGSIALVLAVATHLSPLSEYTVFRHPVMTVVSGSMAPVIKTGDLIVDNRVTAEQAANLQVGQIISFYPSSESKRVFTHRIYAVTRVHGEKAYVTKGDVNKSPDTTPVLASAVIGVYAHKIPYGGYALNALHRPLTLILLIASPILWFLAGPLISWARRDDERRRPAHLTAGAEVR